MSYQLETAFINIMAYIELLFGFWIAKNVMIDRMKLKTKWIVLAVLLCQLGLAIFYINDMALVYVYNLGYANILPYGVLWFILNSFWFTVHTYLWYLLGWEVAFVGILWFLQKRQIISTNVIYWYMILCLFLTLDHNPQSIVPITFIFLIPAFGPLALVPAALIKFPIGWSWNFTDSHWNCAFGNSQFVLQQWLVPCNHIVSLNYWLLYPTLFYNWFTYGLIAWFTIWNLKIWAKDRPRALAAKILLKTGLFYPLRIFLLERLGLFERKVVKIVKACKGDIFIDVGSANGYYAKLARKNFKTVNTVDPNPKWKANYQYALSAVNGYGCYVPITYDKEHFAQLRRFDSLFREA